jgi:uncharacterized lipoprotein YmbA
MKRWLSLLLLLLSACAVYETPTTERLALIAPFEGRDREVGYEALYAARLALADANSALELLPLDDGGTADFAAQRLRALQFDPQVRAVIIMGASASDAQTQAALTDTRPDLDVISVATWNDDSLPSIDFVRRYRASDMFAPEPGALALHIYEIVSLYAAEHLIE